MINDVCLYVKMKNTGYKSRNFFSIGKKKMIVPAYIAEHQ
jgi:hypothetical protein